MPHGLATRTSPLPLLLQLSIGMARSQASGLSHNPLRLPCPHSGCTRWFRNTSGLTKHCHTFHIEPRLRKPPPPSEPNIHEAIVPPDSPPLPANDASSPEAQAGLHEHIGSELDPERLYRIEHPYLTGVLGSMTVSPILHSSYLFNYPQGGHAISTGTS